MNQAQPAARDGAGEGRLIVPRVRNTALLAPAFVNRLGLRPRTKVLDLKDRVRCRGSGARRRDVVSIKWAKSVA